MQQIKLKIYNITTLNYIKNSRSYIIKHVCMRKYIFDYKNKTNQTKRSSIIRYKAIQNKIIVRLQRRMKPFDKRHCQQIQNSLNFDLIEGIWKNFRQAGNSIEGKIIKLNFKKVLLKHNITNQGFLDKLFQRFKLQKISLKQQQKQQLNQKTQKQREQIDLQDFVIGLTILSRISFLQKIKHVFQLTDLDQDGCLSLEEIQAMIERIQRIFSKQNSAAKVDSFWLLLNMAQKRAQRNFKQLLFLLRKNNPALTNDQQGLITCDQFIQALKSSRNLYAEQNFLPLNLSLYQILSNTASQPTIKITEESKFQFCDFRKQVCGILQNKSDKQSSNLIKYPGKVEILRNFKVVQVLPAIENNHDKKYNKAIGKKNMTKTNNNSPHNDFKDLYDQKLAEQTLQSYKLKVKKMIQTKNDPRLNVHFDLEVRK